MDNNELKSTFNELERLADNIKERLETIYSKLEDVLDEGILMKLQDTQVEAEEIHDMVVEAIHEIEDKEAEEAARMEDEDKEKIDRVLEEKEKDNPKA